jgi:hypothetical protein
MNYSDYLDIEIKRVKGQSIYARNYKQYLKYAKKIKRREILDISVEILEI